MARFLSRTNSEEIRKEIEAAAKKLFTNFLFAEYDNGQWWIWLDETEEGTVRLFQVVDAVGPGSVDGFGFEEC